MSFSGAAEALAAYPVRPRLRCESIHSPESISKLVYLTYLNLCNTAISSGFYFVIERRYIN